jgi:hypothetical protein
MFEVGEKVVCVRASGLFDCVLPLNEGALYVIRELTHCELDGRLGFYLIGVRNIIHCFSGKEFGYCATRFRKLSDMQAEARARHSKPENVTAN